MTETAINYAKAVFELNIPKSDIEESEDILKENPELFTALCNPSFAAEQKHNAIDKIFQKSMRSVIKLLIDNGSMSIFFDITAYYKKLVEESENTMHAELVYYDAPSAEQLEGIKAKLCKMYNVKKVDFTTVEDKTIIGGFIIKTDGKELDYSLRGRLEGLGQKLIR